SRCCGRRRSGRSRGRRARWRTDHRSRRRLRHSRPSADRETSPAGSCSPPTCGEANSPHGRADARFADWCAPKWDDLLVDGDEPEERIAELDRGLADHRGLPEPMPSLDPRVGTPVDAQAPAHRGFMATAPRMKMKTFAILFVYGGTAALIGLPFLLNA